MDSVSIDNFCNKSLTLSESASATIIGSNCNLLVDILYCLPRKTLSVFKSVSKQWQSLISDPSFERNYNLRHPLIRLALLLERGLHEFEILVIDEQKDMDSVPSKIPSIVKDPTLYEDLWITFEQSCNGLLLFKVHDYYDDDLTLYVIYNPSTKLCKTLPSTPIRKNGFQHDVVSMTIAFDPAKSSYYQVVAAVDVSWIDIESVFHIEIYSSKTDSWRFVDVGNPCLFSISEIYRHYGVYWNGSVHWIDNSSGILYYFDIESELIKKTAMPTDPKEDIAYFNECRGHMHLMQMRNDDMPGFDIWEMRKDYTGWNVKYYVDLTALTTVYKVLVFRPFFMDVLLIEEGEDSSRLILWILQRKAISFDLKNKRFKEIYDGNGYVRVEGGFPYIETLDHD